MREIAADAARHRCARRRAAWPSARADCGDLLLVRDDRLARQHAEARRRRARPPADGASRRRTRPRSARNVFTMRSSSEWNETTDEPPAGLQHALGRRERRAQARPARRSRTCAAPGTCASPDGSRRACDARRAATMSASCARGRDRLARRAPSRSRARRAREPLLAERRDDDGEIALGRGVHQIGGARALAAHAHVERAVVAEREAALRPRRAASTRRRDRAGRRRPRHGRARARPVRDWRSGPRRASAALRPLRPAR